MISIDFPLNLHTSQYLSYHCHQFGSASRVFPGKVAEIAAQKSQTDEDLGPLGALGEKTPNRRRFKSVVSGQLGVGWFWMV